MVNRRGFIKWTAALSAAALVRPGRAAGQATDSPEPVAVGAGPETFLDDWVVHEMRGLTRTLRRPVKQGLIQEQDGRPWDRGCVSSVVRDTRGRFHMTYRLLYWDPSVRGLHPSIGEDKAHWFRLVPCYATSQDGIRWTKPVLGLVDGPTGFRPAPEPKWKDGVFEEPAGFSRDNNQGCPIAVIKDLGQFGNVADPAQRYLVNVVRRNDTHAFAEVIDAGLYFAADVPDLAGDPGWRSRMTVIWEGRRRGPRGDTVCPAGYEPASQEWFACHQSSFGSIQQRGREVGRWTSKDLTEWSREELVLPIADDESTAPEDYIEYMDMYVNRIGGAWLGFLVIFHGDRRDPMGEMPTAKNVWRKGVTDVRLMVSRDAGKTWQRVSGKDTWLSCHQAEDGYDRLAGMPTLPVRMGDEVWFYYGCWDGDHLSWRKDGVPYYPNRVRVDRTARATLRTDGYVSLDASGDGGELLTKPLCFKGSRLRLNLAAAHGAAGVEVQRADGTPAPGLALGDSVRVTGDGVGLEARWKDMAALQRLEGEPVRLRLVLRNAALYGFQFV